nr:hypothetical protein [Tanacetum cinerariifolium]
MAPKKTTRSTPAITTTTTTTPVTNAQLKALLDQCVVDALAACDANRSRNGEDSHDSGMGVRRQASPVRKDKRPHARTARLMKSEARLSREAWVYSMDASGTTRAERQQGPARGQAHTEVSEEADSSS